jgi:hypothetical protein
MKSISTKHDSSQAVADTAVGLFDNWFDPIEAAVRDRVAIDQRPRSSIPWHRLVAAIVVAVLAAP